MPDEEDLTQLSLKGVAPATIFKAIATAFLVGGIWARVEIGLSGVKADLDSIKANQAYYLRADLAEEQRNTTNAKLDDLKAEMQRLSKKLDQ